MTRRLKTPPRASDEGWFQQNIIWYEKQLLMPISKQCWRTKLRSHSQTKACAKEYLNGSYRLFSPSQTIFGMASCHPFSQKSPVAHSQSYDPLMFWLLPKVYWLCTLKITSLLESAGRTVKERRGSCQNVEGSKQNCIEVCLFRTGICNRSRWTPRQPRSSFHANRPTN